VVDSDEYEWEWRNFLYGGLAGLGGILILIVLYQLLCFKKIQKSRDYDMEMSSYVRD